MVVGGDYRLTHFLGQGGMGAVFVAEHKLMPDKPVALKILFPHMVNQDTWLRFQREARVLGKLDHRGIVKILNMGVDRERCPFYVMELLSGYALSDFVKKQGRLSVEVALPLFLQVAEALEFAHRNGVIHRDLKPSNIMLVENDSRTAASRFQAKVVDFGIAMQVAPKNSVLFRHEQSLTKPGEVFGTPYYMSPEQILGEELTPATDVYSLGCTFFEVLTGKPPFRGPTAYDTVNMHLKASPPRLGGTAGVPFDEELELVMARALAKDPSKRYASMLLFSNDFNRAFHGYSVVAAGIKSSGFKNAEAEASAEEHFMMEAQSSYRARKSQSSILFITLGLLLVALGAGFAITLVLANIKNSTDTHVGTASDITSKGTAGHHALLSIEEDIGVLDGGKRTGLTEFAVEETDTQLEVELSKIGSFNSPLSAKSRYVDFHFPEQMDVGEIFAEGGRPVRAMGTVRLPSQGRKIFCLRKDYSPIVLSKFAKNSVILQVEIGRVEDLKSLVQVLKGWDFIGQLKLKGCALDEETLALLNALPPIKVLRTYNSETFYLDYAKARAFRELGGIELDKPRESRAAIAAGATVAAESTESYKKVSGIFRLVQCLAALPHLTLLGGSFAPVNDPIVDELIKSKSLSIFRFDRTYISAANLKKLCCKPGVTEVKAFDMIYTPDEVEKALPPSSKKLNLLFSVQSYTPEQLVLLKEQGIDKTHLTKLWTLADEARIRRKVASLTFVPRTNYYIEETHNFTSFDNLTTHFGLPK